MAVRAGSRQRNLEPAGRRPKGSIVYEGAIDNSPMGKKREGVINYVDKALAELTGGKAVSTPETKPYGCSVKYAQ